MSSRALRFLPAGILLVSVSACGEPPPLEPDFAPALVSSTAILGSSMPVTGPSVLAALTSQMETALSTTSSSSTFLAFTRFPAETRAWRTQAADTAYNRDWFVGGQTFHFASQDGEQFRAQATRPDGQIVDWNAITYFRTFTSPSGEELEHCWIGQGWRHCGSPAMSVNWYVQSQCAPPGEWSMRFYHDGSQFASGSFIVLPRIEPGRVPIYSQGDPAWGSENYANRCRVGRENRHDCDGRPGEVKQTIAQLGCNLTSVAMVLSYHGVTVDPPTLNTWLIDNGGYDNGDLDPRRIPAYAATRGIQISYVGRTDSVDDQRLSQYLCQYGPQVIAVWGSTVTYDPNRHPWGHFVVAGGRDPHRSTVTIKESAGGFPTTLQDVARYRNTYGGIRAYRGPEHPHTDHLTGITIFLRSPAELLVTDPHGRRSGRDPVAGVTYAEIPGAEYGSNAIDDILNDEPDPNPSKEFGVNQPLAGEYAVEVVGTGTGTYTLSIRTHSRDGQLGFRRFVGVPTAPGVAHRYVVTYDPAAPGGPIGLTGSFSGGGGRSSVDLFLSYSAPVERQTTLPPGATEYTLMIFYGGTIIPSTFSAVLDGEDISHLFKPRPGEVETVSLPLQAGRNVLLLKVDGEDRERIGTDRDRLTFTVR
jgi:hypothetical protein